MVLVIFAVLAGAVLGQRFNAFVLVPAVGFALLAAIGVGLARADPIWSTVLMTAAATASLQIGTWLELVFVRLWLPSGSLVSM